jgi:hypothetical protein
MLLPELSTSQIDTFAERKREDDGFERAKSSKLAKTEPHELNFPSKYGLMQRIQDEKILDDCPAPDTRHGHLTAAIVI